MPEQAAIVLAGAARASHIDACLALLSSERFVQEVNRVGPTGTNALHIASWRNHLTLVRALLASGADPNTPDKESGWTSLHRAFHFGNLRVAAALLSADADIEGAADWRGRSPLDLLSWTLKRHLPVAGPGEVYAWGAGTNYALGTGCTEPQAAPARVDSLHGRGPASLSAAKFHSAAVTEDGRLYTWGFGRGGRLGHPDVHLHTGECAVIAPREVASLRHRCVTAVAAAKHHTLICTSSGEVWAMGSNRHGQLGISAVDTQPEPRRVSSLRSRVVAVAAANKHSVAVTAAGELFSWGSNSLGQLGYGTFDSATSCTPRLVEALKGRSVVAAAAAKRHTVVLTDDGDVFTWGHRGVSPRRVPLAGSRDATATDGRPLKFHRGHADVVRPEAAAICAGAAHSSALTTTGVVLCWRSADPALHVQEVGGELSGKRAVSVSAGKYRSAVVTEDGSVYAWEGRSDFFPAEGRRSGSGSKKAVNGGSAGKLVIHRGSGTVRSTPVAVGSGSDSGRRGLLGSSYGTGDYGSCGSYGYGSPGMPTVGGGAGSQRSSSSFFERVYASKRGGGASGGKGIEPATPRTAARASLQSMDAFDPIVPLRVPGLRKAALVAVGEKHSLALQRWGVSQLDGLDCLPSWVGGGGSTMEEDEDVAGPPHPSSPTVSPQKVGRVEYDAALASCTGTCGPPSLQALCEEEVARTLVDPRTALQVLEYADVAGAPLLRSYCLAVAVCNLDAVLTEARGAFEELPPHLVEELEMVYKAQFMAGIDFVMGAEKMRKSAVSPTAAAANVPPPRPLYSRPRYRLQSGTRPTAALPSAGDASRDTALVPGEDVPTGGVDYSNQPSLRAESSFKDLKAAAEEETAFRLRRTLTKKLQQIEHLEERAAGGQPLDRQQRAKVEQHPILTSALAALDSGMPPEEVATMLQAAAIAAAESIEGGGASPSQSPSHLNAAAGLSTPTGKPPIGGPTAPGGSNGSGSNGSGGTKSRTRARRTRLQSSKSVLSKETSFASYDDGRLMSGMITGTSDPGDSIPPFPNLSSPQPQERAPAQAQQTQSPSMLPQKHIVGFATCPVDTGSSTNQKKSSSKPAPRKGGLSMFLRGGLDAAQPPKCDGTDNSSGGGGAPTSSFPASPWGGCSSNTGMPTAIPSLKHILASSSEERGKGESATAGRSLGHLSRPSESSPAPSGSASTSKSDRGTGSGKRMPLSTFLGPTNPLDISQSGAGGREGGGTAWGGASGASPPSTHRISLVRIQEEQELIRRTSGHTWGASPPASGTAGTSSVGGGHAQGSSPRSSATSVAGTSPSGRAFFASPPPQSRWYVPDRDGYTPKKSLALIQHEESALKELEKLYGEGNARIVKSVGVGARRGADAPLPPPSSSGGGAKRETHKHPDHGKAPHRRGKAKVMHAQLVE